ncbi:hypothetical protein L9F63_009645, partial [Diploptera punctata]
EILTFVNYFSPCIENAETKEEEKFLPTDPRILMSMENINSIPLVIGYTSQEGMVHLKGLQLYPHLKLKLFSEAEYIIPYTINLKNGTPESEELASNIKEFYFGDKPVSQETLPQLVDIYSDAFFIHGIRKTAHIHCYSSDSPVYLYQFSFDEGLELVKKLLSGHRLPGVCHAGELPYLFKGFYIEEERLHPDTDHTKMKVTMVKLWTNFAKTGIPTPNGHEDIGVTWEPLSKREQSYLDINLTPSMKMDKERYEFWDDILNEGSHVYFQVTSHHLIDNWTLCINRLSAFFKIEILMPSVALDHEILYFATNVTVAEGSLRGKKVQSSINDVKYYSFQGIPYAKPPTGPLRFKAPQPVDPWEGVRDALSEGSVAPQFDDVIDNVYKGEEDCLYLNVYTPKVPSGDEDDLKSVMVWIHGGGFCMGSGNIRICGPEYLMNEDVVLVTFNYRLGALGFLSTQDSETSSNNGLKDQVMVLKWVQQNIAQFGGNPKNVTIFGVSAGAGSVHFHLFSPLSKGLFHRAIAMSGVVLNPWALVQNPRDRAFRLGETLGCKTTDSKKLVEFLRTVPAMKLVDNVEKAQTPQEKASHLLFFAPTLENGTSNEEEIFLHDTPINLIMNGKFHKVPFITGVTSHEGMLLFKAIHSNPTLLNDMNNNYEFLIPSTLNLKKGSSKSEEVAQKIKKFYFGNKSVGIDTLDALINFFSDIFFIVGLKKTVEIHVKKSDMPLYLYQFSYDEKLGMIEKYLGTSVPGVCHGAEIAFIFKGFFVSEDKLNPNSPYMKTVSKVVKLWANFAKFGNPTPTQDPLLNVIWNPITENEMNYLDINNELTMKKDLAKERTAFWEELEMTLRQCV